MATIPVEQMDLRASGPAGKLRKWLWNKMEYI
jgi:hypothetical protein